MSLLDLNQRTKSQRMQRVVQVPIVHLQWIWDKSSSGSRGARGHAPPPRPCKISHKKMATKDGKHRFHVSCPPPPPPGRCIRYWNPRNIKLTLSSQSCNSHYVPSRWPASLPSAKEAVGRCGFQSCVSICPQGEGSQVTITQDALDLTVQGPIPTLCLPKPLSTWDLTVQPPPPPSARDGTTLYSDTLLLKLSVWTECRSLQAGGMHHTGMLSYKNNHRSECIPEGNAQTKGDYFL